MCNGELKYELKDVKLFLEDLKIYRKNSSRSIKSILLFWKIIGAIYCFLQIVIPFILFIIDVYKTNFNIQDYLNISSITTIFLDMVILTIGVVLPWILLPIFFKNALRMAYYSDGLDQKTQDFEFSDLGLRVISKHGESKYNWNELYSISEVNGQILFYTSKIQAFIIPIRYLEGNKDLIAFLRTKVGSQLSVGGVA